jgi:hypothetical protein
MLTGHKVEQSDITATDVAGNNIYKTTNNYGTTSRTTQLAILGARFQEEQEKNHRISHIIDKLLRYSSVVAEEATEVIGLENKLIIGGYQHYLLLAASAKEVFAKHLFKYQFSESAQKMYAFLLAKMWNCFQTHVYPAILQNRSQQEVMVLVGTHVYAVIEDCLGENILELYDDEIAGMLFYLTGNCHIKWK